MSDDNRNDNLLTLDLDPGPVAGVGSGAESVTGSRLDSSPGSGSGSGSNAGSGSAFHSDSGDCGLGSGSDQDAYSDQGPGSGSDSTSDSTSTSTSDADPAGGSGSGAGGWRSGGDIVQGILGMTRTINEWEAQRLLLIADLCDHECMIALPPSEAAQSAAQRRAAQLTMLSQLDMASKELGMALHVSDYSARRLLRLAIALATRLTGTRTHLAHGDLDRARADIIDQHADPLAEHHYDRTLAQKKSPQAAEQAARNICQALEALILPNACSMTPAQLHKALRKAVMRLDPEFVDEQAQEKSRGRHVWYRTHDDGTGEIHIVVGAAEATAIYNTLDGYARLARKQGSSRTLDQLRADMATHLIVETSFRKMHSATPEESAAGTAADPQVNTDDAIIVPDVDPNTGDIYRGPEPAAQNGAGTTTGSGATAETGETAKSTSGQCESRDAAPPHHAEFTHASAPAQEWAQKSEPNAPTERDPETILPEGSAFRFAAPKGAAAGGGAQNGAGSTVPPFGPSACGVPAHVQVVVTLDTLMGLSEEPGDLIGHGPITANTARDLAMAAGSTWSRLVVDPLSGYLLDHGRTRYRPPVALADHVRARDFTCRMPNCERPAGKSDLDHIIPWPAGTTSASNLGAACDRDHRFKHQGKWTHQMSTDPAHPEFTLIMTSPTGQVYLSYPHGYLDPPMEKAHRKS